MAVKNEKTSNKSDWDELTDSFIEGIDDSLMNDSPIKLREMLTNPVSYASKSTASDALTKAKNAIDQYFKNVLSVFENEQKALDNELQSTSINYAKFSSTITEKAEMLKLPYIKPYLLEFNENNRETITLDTYDSSVELLLGKLLLSSKYVAEVSGTYKNHTLGSWLFSSDKAYVVTIKPPESVILDIENSKDIILSYLNGFSDQINLFKAIK